MYVAKMLVTKINTIIVISPGPPRRIQSQKCHTTNNPKNLDKIPLLYVQVFL